MHQKLEVSQSLFQWDHPCTIKCRLNCLDNQNITSKTVLGLDTYFYWLEYVPSAASIVYIVPLDTPPPASTPGDSLHRWNPTPYTHTQTSRRAASRAPANVGRMCALFFFSFTLSQLEYFAFYFCGVFLSCLFLMRNFYLSVIKVWNLLPWDVRAIGLAALKKGVGPTHESSMANLPWWRCDWRSRPLCQEISVLPCAAGWPHWLLGLMN